MSQTFPKSSEEFQQLWQMKKKTFFTDLIEYLICKFHDIHIKDILLKSNIDIRKYFITNIGLTIVKSQSSLHCWLQTSSLPFSLNDENNNMIIYQIKRWSISNNDWKQAGRLWIINHNLVHFDFSNYSKVEVKSWGY